MEYDCAGLANVVPQAYGIPLPQAYPMRSRRPVQSGRSETTGETLLKLAVERSKQSWREAGKVRNTPSSLWGVR